MNKRERKEIQSKFTEFLVQNWENPKKIDDTVKRFSSKIFDIFFDWLKSYKTSPRYYKQVFNEIVLPQMKLKIEKNFWNIYFNQKNYEKYQSLFVSFMIFAKENTDYINELFINETKEKLENSVDWMFWTHFNKKALIHAWHNYINKDTWVNGDKFREYLNDIYLSLNNENLKTLYDIFFDSYEICSSICSENAENKENENFEKRNAFDEAFSNLKNNLEFIQWENLDKIKSLFWKYLNFIPRYRKELIKAMWGKTENWSTIQKDTETSLLETLWDETDTTITQAKKQEEREQEKDLWIKWDWFWDVVVVESSRDKNQWVYDQTERWDIIAPIDYWIFSDTDAVWESETTDNHDEESKARKKKKKTKKDPQINIDFD